MLVPQTIILNNKTLEAAYSRHVDLPLIDVAVVLSFNWTERCSGSGRVMIQIAVVIRIKVTIPAG